MAIYTGHNEDSSGNLLLSIGNGMTATVETGATASQVYAKGAYLFFNNKLCKATVAISSGANLVIGTNLAQTNIGTELTTHLRSSDAKEFYFDVKDGRYGFYPTSSKTASEFVPFGGSLVYSHTFSGSAYTTDQSVRITVTINTGITGLAHPVVALNNVILGPYQANVYANATAASYNSTTGVITITSEQIYSGNSNVTITGTVYLFDT